MKVVNLLKPRTTKVVVALCVLRNSTGENGYVPDEVITSKSGRRVRIVNTDIEGRLSIADALFHIKEMAMYSVNPHIFTIATVMTQAKLATGTGYSVIILLHFLYFYFFRKIKKKVKWESKKKSHEVFF